MGEKMSALSFLCVIVFEIIEVVEGMFYTQGLTGTGCLKETC